MGVWSCIFRRGKRRSVLFFIFEMYVFWAVSPAGCFFFIFFYFFYFFAPTYCRSASRFSCFESLEMFFHFLEKLTFFRVPPKWGFWTPPWVVFLLCIYGMYGQNCCDRNFYFCFLFLYCWNEMCERVCIVEMNVWLCFYWGNECLDVVFGVNWRAQKYMRIHEERPFRRVFMFSGYFWRNDGKSG